MFSLKPWIFLCTLGEDSNVVEGETPQNIVDAWAGSGIEEPGFSTMFMALFVVIVLIFALSWVTRRFLRIHGAGSPHSGLRVLETLPLGGKRLIQVVRVHGRNLVIGAAGDRIELLTELTEEEIDPESLLERKNLDKLSNILPFRKKLKTALSVMKVK
ncbi:MAG: flagellar biosynthetic protein FliO [Planctomycetota bacterium]